MTLPRRAPRFFPGSTAVPSTASGELVLLYCCRCRCCSATAAAAAALLLPLLAGAVLFCCLFCSCSPSHGVGRPGISCYAFPARAPPGSPSSTEVPGAASGVHDVLLRLLLPLVCRCSGADAMHMLLLCCSAAALAMSEVWFSC